MLGYWGQPQKTAEKISGGWLRTGDMGCMDKDGIFTFVARDDDVITSAGYRVGPSEIENCLMQHPRVQLAAVIGLILSIYHRYLRIDRNFITNNASRCLLRCRKTSANRI